MSKGKRPILRRTDYSLTEEQLALREVFRAFFERECPTSRVRQAEAIAFDDDLWARLDRLGVATMGVPVEHGGDGASLNDLALVAEEAGRALAPVPIVETMVAGRALARVAELNRGAGVGIEPGITTVAVSPGIHGHRQVVTAGGATARLLALDGDELLLISLPDSGRPRGSGSGPLAWWEPGSQVGGRHVVAKGEDARSEFQAFRTEWQLLAAAALVGAACGAQDLAVEHAKERNAFGVPIGTFQAIAHPLVDVETAILGARRLVWKASWFCDHEPQHLGPLARMAFLHAAETAGRATRTGIHTLGGIGFTCESDMQLYFLRARTWSLLGGDPHDELVEVADGLFGPVA